MSKVEKLENGCWIWTGADNGTGYGRIRGDDEHHRHVYVHRVSYEIHVGPIPEGLTIDHLCLNTRCVNPQHLVTATMQENIAREWDGRRQRAA